MFESTTLRLTIMYVAILSVICILFSTNWYLLARNDIEGARNRQIATLKRPGPVRDIIIREELIKEVEAEADEQFKEDMRSLVSRILFTNAIIITAGTAGSYLLARKSIEPIERAHLEQIRFTADASHELRTPLTAMRTEIDVALRDPKLSKADAIKQLESTSEELVRMSSLSEQLLKLSRTDEHIELPTQRTSVKSIVQTSLDRVLKQAEQRIISFQEEIDDEFVITNPDTAAEILSVLFENAIKYSDKKSTVQIKTITVRNAVQIAIKDQGIGISQLDQQHIFERFYRADHSRTSGSPRSGHGLGLSIAATLASRLPDTALKVESEGHGLGSTFTITLPKSH
jgi:signal transduction histidine kinase